MSKKLLLKKKKKKKKGSFGIMKSIYKNFLLNNKIQMGKDEIKKIIVLLLILHIKE